MTTAHGPAGPAVTGTGRALIPPHTWSLTVTEPTALALLRDTEAYLSALHTHVARHDQIGADLTCGGCVLRDRIAAALPQLAAVPPANQTTDRAALRDRIAAAIWERQNPGRRYADCEYRWKADAEEDADAVLAVLPEPVDRAAILTEAADALDAYITRYRSPSIANWTGAVAFLRRLAAEAQPTTQPDEDPARIDRLRPEFFEHASVESIDLQIQRARRQQRHWGNRERTLAILRQARVTQKERGEWPAAGARQDGAQQ